MSTNIDDAFHVVIPYIFDLWSIYGHFTCKKYDVDENTWKHVVFLQNVKKLLQKFD